jgi:hypothetical protein
VRRLGVALAYTLAFVATDLIFRTRAATGKAAWLNWASTNLANLPHHPIGSLVLSAFLAEGDPWRWAALALVGLGVVNWSLGNWRTAVLGWPLWRSDRSLPRRSRTNGATNRADRAPFVLDRREGDEVW